MKQKLFSRRLCAGLALIIPLILFGCDTTGTDGSSLQDEFQTGQQPSQETDKKEFPCDIPAFEREKKAWESQGYQNYSYAVNYHGNTGPENFNVTIKDGTLLEFTPIMFVLAEHEPFINEIYRGIINGTTISDLYSKLERDINYTKDEWEQGKYEEVFIEIEYNAMYHYPESIVFYSRDTDIREGANPGAFYYTLEITDFTPIKEFPCDIPAFEREKKRGEVKGIKTIRILPSITATST